MIDVFKGCHQTLSGIRLLIPITPFVHAHIQTISLLQQLDSNWNCGYAFLHEAQLVPAEPGVPPFTMNERASEIKSNQLKSKGGANSSSVHLIYQYDNITKPKNHIVYIVKKRWVEACCFARSYYSSCCWRQHQQRHKHTQMLFPFEFFFQVRVRVPRTGTEGEKKGRRREEEAECGLFSVQWFQRVCGAVCGAVNSCPEVWVLTPPRFHMLLSKCMHACTVRLQIQVRGRLVD